MVDPKPTTSDVHPKAQSDYDDPGELDLDAVISKYVPEVSPNKVKVNDVEIDNGINDDSFSERRLSIDEYDDTESHISESHDTESRESRLNGLKRFSGFQGALDQIGADSNDDNDDEEDGDVTMNRTLDETIEEVAVDLEKINNSFGFSIQVCDHLCGVVAMFLMILLVFLL